MDEGIWPFSKSGAILHFPPPVLCVDQSDHRLILSVRTRPCLIGASGGAFDFGWRLAEVVSSAVVPRSQVGNLTLCCGTVLGNSLLLHFELVWKDEETE